MDIESIWNRSKRFFVTLQDRISWCCSAWCFLHKLQTALVCNWFLKAMNGVKKLRCNWQNISDFILFPVLFPWTVFQTFCLLWRSLISFLRWAHRKKNNSWPMATWQTWLYYFPLVMNLQSCVKQRIKNRNVSFPSPCSLEKDVKLSENVPLPSRISCISSWFLVEVRHVKFNGTKYIRCL